MRDASPLSPLVVGIDVGGTKTHLRAVADADLVADRVRASSGRRPHDPVAAAGWLAALVADALPGGRRPAAVAVGGHACETPRQCARIRTALQLHFDAPALVVGDADLLVPAAGLDKGVGLVAGAGSVRTAAAVGSTVPVLHAAALRGRFDRIELNSGHLRAVPVYTAEGLSVRLLKR
ncbi:hypothetical protein [Streptomyces sp. P17]|uniref:hypothetical protein n=1 Tax=Streptomyces sp. P17 TaxID=3074716 RepID=UPI0037DBF1CA